MRGLRPYLAAALAAASLLAAPPASADSTDAQFIGEVSFYMGGRYLDPGTTNALIVDAKKVCTMSDAGFSGEALVYIQGKWHPSDSIGFMQAATKAYCPQHLSEWQGV